MRILLLFMVGILAGCSHVIYRNGPVTVERWSLGTDLELKPISDSANTRGDHTVKIGGLDSNQSQAIGAAVEGAVSAIMKGAKP